MSPVITYINENDVETMFQQIIKSKKDKHKIVQDIRNARTEMQIKSQQLQWKLEECIEGEHG